MPIYAYRCESCGFGKDLLQKMSDAPLTQCPECGKDAFRKQVTAAGFQLKGSGWYVTDFRGGSGASNGTKPATGDSNAAAPAKADGGKSDAGSSDSGTSTAIAPAAPAAAPASNSGADSA
jgi:putative FmdB family regulatory protein